MGKIQDRLHDFLDKTVVAVDSLDEIVVVDIVADGTDEVETDHLGNS